ncbi:MAG: hypothetical protein S0880_36805 [Actinomycetota bacterium]|nr:hypothetical protein [Actinomycetota bacterium]
MLLLEHLARGLADSSLATLATYRDVDVGEGPALVAALRRLSLMLHGRPSSASTASGHDPAEPQRYETSGMAATGPHLTLRGLPSEELAFLVDTFGGAPMEVDELVRRTGGNPLFCRGWCGCWRWRTWPSCRPGCGR